TVKPHHLIVSEHMDGLRIASCDANRIHWIASQFALQSETVKNDNRTFWLFLNSNRTGVINPVIAESNRSPLTAQRYVRRPEDHGPPLGGRCNNCQFIAFLKHNRERLFGGGFKPGYTHSNRIIPTGCGTCMNNHRPHEGA